MKKLMFILSTCFIIAFFASCEDINKAQEPVYDEVFLSKVAGKSILINPITRMPKDTKATFSEDGKVLDFDTMLNGTETVEWSDYVFVQATTEFSALYKAKDDGRDVIIKLDEDETGGKITDGGSALPKFKFSE